jgi:DUF177 domain-containing protein
MKALKEFTIPIEGLSDGMHQFDFQIDKQFFTHFEASPIKDGDFELKLHFDKRPDMLVLTFDLTGTFKTDCERCLENINLPVTDSLQIIIKYSDDAVEEDEIIYIPQETKMLNVAKYAYESVILSIPIIKVCDEIDDPPCNEKMLGYLDRNEEKQEDSGNPIWEALKNFKKNN